MSFSVLGEYWMEWIEVIENPLLQNLPFKMELNKFGKILMSPASNRHGQIQIEIGYHLMNELPNGKVIAECSIQTIEGVIVADVAWASDDFINTFSYETPYPKAPEICIEIVSPSNSKLEISEKVNLYLAKGAQEVWVIYDDNRILTFTHVGEVDKSKIAPRAQILR
jgi:Uma2 family endonuclease